ncbi:ciliary microtubule-associated protein 2-like [Clavelina lepadiformis]|uniref:ciliary microtubule-associated protein 2-like n=1 Tax=Clavelina lepadiformis TaxID=159417 RepID=UPI0040420E5F
MATKLYQGAPFGTQTARFDVSGVHPQSKIPGTYTQIPYCKKSTDELKRKLAPGKYSVEVGGFSEQSVNERASGPGWKRSYETMRMAQVPHLLYREQWMKKKELKKKLGPGRYNVNKLDFIYGLEHKPSSTRGICATREQRFRKRLTIDNPAPGTYGKGGVPAALKEEKQAKSASVVGILDAGSSTPRSLPTVGCELAPGRYEKKTFTEEILSKVVSKRGPYDPFTGERNKAIKTGHLAVVAASDLGPGEYRLSSFLDDWKNVHRQKHGQFGKVDQYPKQSSERVYCCTLSQCPRRPTSPAPNSYYQNKSDANQRDLPPFLSSAERFDRRANKFFTGNVNPVGAGRYNVQKWNEAQHRYGSAHVFNSTQPRFYSKERDFFMKERVRQKDVPLSNRIFLVEPDNAKSIRETASA